MSTEAGQGKADDQPEGKAEAKVEALICLVERRFGPIPDALRSWVTGVFLAALERSLDPESQKNDLRQSLLDVGRAALAVSFDDLVATVRYVLGEPNEIDAGILRQVLAEIVPGQEERVMSIAAEQWKAEGKAEGEAKGKAKGKAEALMRLLERRFGPIPDDLHSQVAGADLVTLDRWFDRALDASALDAVFGDAKH